MTAINFHPASFRDPAGFVFEQEGTIYRHIRPAYAKEYELLMRSGLYASLAKKEWLVPHEEVSENISGDPDFYKTLLPAQIRFISYPYEWSFDMLKDAALLTLQVCIEAIGHGMILKDATAYNIQFLQCKPLFIDTLSFEAYDASQPWVAYRQFCEMFLCPLLLSHYAGENLAGLLLSYPEGIPVPLCARLLPFGSRFRLLSLLHIHLQANLQAGKKGAGTSTNFTRQKLLNLLHHLVSGIRSLKPAKAASAWSDYYSGTIKSAAYLTEKQAIFSTLLQDVQAATAIDIGANNGLFSRLMAQRNIGVTATDADANAINDLYNSLKKDPLPNLLPLVLDISNPTPSTGWQNRERSSFLQRGQYDLVVALALVHHLAIGQNIPLPRLAACFHQLCRRFLITEFVEKEDEKALLLLERKQLRYEWYNKAEFEKQLSVYFDLMTVTPLHDGLRTMYLWRRR